MHRQNRTFAVAAVALVSACTDATGPANPRLTDPLRARLVAEGFPESLIADAGDRFVIDGDIVVRKPDLAARLGSISQPPLKPSRQWISNYRVAGYAYINVTVNTIGLQGASDWADAMRQAFAEYNALAGGGIRFVEQNNSYAMVKTNTFFETTNRVAYAYYPEGDGSPGDSLLVNTYYNGYNLAQKKLMIMHELGHVIGFVHADWQTNNNEVPPTGTVRIGNTPENDTDSYMQSHIGGIPWTSFPYYDRAAFRIAYPGPGAVLTPAVSGGHPSLSWSAAPDAIRYDVYYITKQQDEQTGLWVDSYTQFVASTTSTAMVDFSRSASSVSTPCDAYNPNPAYSVVIIFPENAQTYGSGLGAACFQ